MLQQSLNYKQQQGFTMLGWMFVITLVLYFAYLAMILTPAIMKHYSVEGILTSLEEEAGITQKSKSQIYSTIKKRLDVNRIEGIEREDFEIVKGGDTVTVYLDYDDKVHFAGDIYILFEKSLSVELVRN